MILNFLKARKSHQFDVDEQGETKDNLDFCLSNSFNSNAFRRIAI